LKNVADYEQDRTVSIADAERAINEAAHLVETVATIIAAPAADQ
jgi:hypothetical protein